MNRNTIKFFEIWENHPEWHHHKEVDFNRYGQDLDYQRFIDDNSEQWNRLYLNGGYFEQNHEFYAKVVSDISIFDKKRVAKKFDKNRIIYKEKLEKLDPIEL